MPGKPQLDATIAAAQQIVTDGDDLDLSKLDRVYDLQRLLGPILAYKVLLEISVNSADSRERRQAATTILNASNENPEKIADRLRASVFQDLTLDQLNAIVQTGITDPEVAMARLKEASDE